MKARLIDLAKLNPLIGMIDACWMYLRLDTVVTPSPSFDMNPDMVWTSKVNPHKCFNSATSAGAVF